MSEWTRIDAKQRRAYVTRDVCDFGGTLAEFSAAFARAAEGLNDPEISISGDYGGGVDVEVVGWRPATDDEITTQAERERKAAAAREAFLGAHPNGVMFTWEVSDLRASRG